MVKMLRSPILNCFSPYATSRLVRFETRLFAPARYRAGAELRRRERSDLATRCHAPSHLARIRAHHTVSIDLERFSSPRDGCENVCLVRRQCHPPPLICPEASNWLCPCPPPATAPDPAASEALMNSRFSMLFCTPCSQTTSVLGFDGSYSPAADSRTVASDPIVSEWYS